MVTASDSQYGIRLLLETRSVVTAAVAVGDAQYYAAAVATRRAGIWLTTWLNLSKTGTIMA